MSRDQPHDAPLPGAMAVVSVNIGLPRTIEWQGRSVRTAIWKVPVDGPVAIRRLNLDGDRQGDQRAHGGPDKAVYAYPTAHYTLWRSELPETSFPVGGFGENLTISGFDEETLCIGDRLRVGMAELIVRQPRIPCFKLGIRFGRDDIVKRFLATGRTGVYFAVAREGEVRAGDMVTMLTRDPHRVSVAAIARLYTAGQDQLPALHRAVELPALAGAFRAYCRDRIARLTAHPPSASD